MSNMILSLNNLYKKYGANTVVNDISLNINEGEFVSLLGPSGCGKTTVLRIVAGFCMPDSGNIVLDGKTITHDAPHLRDIGMVFQDYALWPHMTVMQHMTFGLKLKKVPEPEIKKRIDRIVELVRLGGLENRYPKQLSGGQQQRVALARALVMEPRLLLLDEPLSNLDKKLRDLMKMELRRLQKALGITMIFVTHDQSEALALSDHIIVMDKGKVMQQGSSYEIFETPRNIFVADFVGNANFIDAYVRDITGEQITVSFVDDRYTLKVAATHGHSFSVGDAAKIFIRPVNLKIINSGDSDDCIPVEYVGSIYEGGTSRVFVRIKGSQSELMSECSSWTHISEEQAGLYARFNNVRLLAPEES